MIRHIAGIAEIVEDVQAAVNFYREVLGLPVQHAPGDPYAAVEIAGVLHFGIWSRAAAAETVFGDAAAAGRIPLGFTVGFEADSVEAGCQALADRDWPVAQEPKTESWGQSTTRFFSASGALCELSETPWARRLVQEMQAAAQPEQPAE